MKDPGEYPVVFLSHKHVDKNIAQVVSEFLIDESRNAIDLHNSSGDGYLHPETGDRLTEALRRVLWRADVMILIYTSRDHDWSWCMWEAGVANDSQSPDTRIVVFQCMDETPSLFAGQVSVNIRKEEEVRKFVDDFFRSPTFFPGLGRALTPRWSAEGARRAAGRLFSALEQVLPDPMTASHVNVWPHVCFRVPQTDADHIRASHGSSTGVREIVSGAARVSFHSEEAESLFAKKGISGMALAQLRQHWISAAPAQDPAWHDSCCEQIARVIRGDPRLVPQAPIVEPESSSEFIPNLIRHREQPYSDDWEFEFHFVDVSNPHAIPAEDRMLNFGEFFHVSLEDIDPATFKLVDFLDEIDGRGYNRIPFLNGRREIEYVIHRSMFDRYLVRRRDVMPDVTLSDLLNDTQIGSIVRNSIGIVKRTATLADARAEMKPERNCSDVFVTENGRRDEPVLGWITNIELRRRGFARAAHGGHDS